jgi:hypothetical protein
MARQRRCRLCHKRPPWAGKNCPPGVCKACYHRHLWVDRPAARAERRAAAALDQDGGDAWIDGVVERDAEMAAHDLTADEAEPALPPWPIRRVTTGMKRCSLPDARQLVVVFSDLLADEPDPWAEADVDVLAAIQEALDGQTPLFLVVQDDGLSPHYGRITVTGGQARLLLWEGGGSVCDETLAATSADQVMVAARARAQRLIEAYPTRPNVEDELLGGYRPSDRRTTRYRARWRSR